MKKTKQPKIVFKKSDERIYADCLDVYNWLLSKNKNIAVKFEEKYKEAEKLIDKKRKVMQEEQDEIRKSAEDLASRVSTWSIDKSIVPVQKKSILNLWNIFKK